LEFVFLWDEAFRSCFDADLLNRKLCISVFNFSVEPYCIFLTTKFGDESCSSDKTTHNVAGHSGPSIHVDVLNSHPKSNKKNVKRVYCGKK